ncbi:MAG: hypothetical protein AAB425_03885, partial [Bdellovibrionota bacterium]
FVVLDPGGFELIWNPKLSETVGAVVIESVEVNVTFWAVAEDEVLIEFEIDVERESAHAIRDDQIDEDGKE